MKITTDIVLCNSCLEDVDTEEPLQATHYCNNCNKNLCDGHVLFHKTKKSTKDHNLNPLLTSNQQQLNIIEDKNNLINIKLGDIENNEIKNDQLLFNNNNTLQENTLQNNLQKNNFDLIKFKLISKFGGPNYGNKNNKLNYPHDIIYFNNLIYIADCNNSRILILDNSLNYKNEIKLNDNPLSLAINSNNNLFIGCYNNIIYQYNLNTLQLMNEIKNNENHTFDNIYGMTCDNENNLYICNHNNKEIIILNKNNEFIRKFKINLEPRRILINNKNQIVITCYNDEIYIYDKLGNFILNVKFSNLDLRGIINDKNDNYIICDRSNDELLFLNNEFKLKKEINKNLNKPIGITLNEENNQIYIVEFSGHCCKLFK